MKNDNSELLKDSETLEKIIFAITDYANAVEAASVALKQNIKDLAKPAGWNPKKITWTEAEGARGPYEKADPQATPDFKAMLADLKAHSGKLMRDGYFYWVFSDAATVGRKHKPKKKD